MMKQIKRAAYSSRQSKLKKLEKWAQYGLTERQESGHNNQLMKVSGQYRLSVSSLVRRRVIKELIASYM